MLSVITPANEQAASEDLFKTMIEISDMDMRTFFVKNQGDSSGFKIVDFLLLQSAGSNTF